MIFAGGQAAKIIFQLPLLILNKKVHIPDATVAYP